MINEINIIDNIFDDPDHIVAEARKYNFYKVGDYPFEPGHEVYFSGQRTESLSKINNGLYHYCNSTIFSKLIDKSLNAKRISHFSFKHSGPSYFHYQTKEDIFKESWFHKDYCLYAAVIYLQKNPQPNSGTILRFEDKEDVIIENKYNRLIFYRADIQHSVEGTFGNNVYDGRLTFCSFYGNLSISVGYNLNFNYDE